MKNGNVFIFAFLIIITINLLMQMTTSNISLGSKKAKIKIKLYLDISDKRSVNVINEILTPLKKACYAPIEDKNVYLDIIFVSSSNLPMHVGRSLANFINQVQLLTPDNFKCFSCDLNKFHKAIEIFYKINQNFEMLAFTSITEQPKAINKLLPNFDIETIKNILKDNKFQIIHHSENNSFLFNTMNTPLIFMNGISIGGIEPYNINSLFWEKLFKNNFKYVLCKDSDSFFEYFDKI